MADQSRQRLDIISTADGQLGKGIRSTQALIFKEILDKILGFDTEGGKFIPTNRNIRLINELETTIRRIVLNSKYQTNVTKYLRNFDRIKAANISLQKGLGFNVKNIGLTRVQKAIEKQTIANLLGAGMDANFVSPVKQNILESVINGSSIQDATDSLRLFVRGDKQRLGLLDRYVSQTARDSISQFDGNIQTTIANKFNLTSWTYEGSLISDSRAQCRRWVGMGILEAKNFQREINWGFNNGTGMIPGTEPSTFPSFRGGFNCRHAMTPVSL